MGQRFDLPLHKLGFYLGVAAVMLALTEIFNFLPLPFARPLGILARLALLMGIGALALGFVAQRQSDNPDDLEMARNAIIAGAAAVVLFIGLLIFGMVIGSFLA